MDAVSRHIHTRALAVGVVALGVFGFTYASGSRHSACGQEGACAASVVTPVHARAHDQVIGTWVHVVDPASPHQYAVASSAALSRD